MGGQQSQQEITTNTIEHLQHRFKISSHPIYRQQALKILHQKLTNELFILRIMTTNNQAEYEQLEEQICQKMAIKTHSVITPLQHYIFQQQQSYCTKIRKCYLLFRVGDASQMQTLKNRVLKTIKGQCKPLSAQCCIRGIRSMLLAISIQRHMWQKHENITQNTIYINSEGSMILLDPWISPKKNIVNKKYTCYSYSSPQRYYRTGIQQNYDPYLSDIFSLGITMLILIHNNLCIPQQIYKNQKINFNAIKDISLRKFVMKLLEDQTHRQMLLNNCKMSCNRPLRATNANQNNFDMVRRCNQKLKNNQMINPNINTSILKLTQIPYRPVKCVLPNQEVNKPNYNIVNKNSPYLHPRITHTNYGKESPQTQNLIYKQPHINPVYVQPNFNKFHYTKNEHTIMKPKELSVIQQKTSMVASNQSLVASKPLKIQEKKVENIILKQEINKKLQQTVKEMDKNNDKLLMKKIENDKAQYRKLHQDIRNLQKMIGDTLSESGMFDKLNTMQNTNTLQYINKSKSIETQKQSVQHEQKLNITPQDQKVIALDFGTKNGKKQENSQQSIDEQIHMTQYQIHQNVNSSLNQKYNSNPNNNYIINIQSNSTVPSVEDGPKNALKMDTSELNHTYKKYIETRESQPKNENDKESDSFAGNQEIQHIGVQSDLSSDLNEHRPTDIPDDLIKEENAGLECNQQCEALEEKQVQQQNDRSDHEYNRYQTPTRQLGTQLSQIKDLTIPEEGSEEQEESNEKRPRGEYIYEEYENGGWYEGYSYDNMRNGEGTFYYQEGGHYEGNWKDNTMNGYGKLYYDSGMLAYQGQWYRDQFHGRGKVYNDGAQQLDDYYDYRNFDNIEFYWLYYEGDLSHDMKAGYGKIMLSNGEYYKGEFRKDKAHGKGVYYKKNGTYVKGIWNEGHLVKEI